MRFIEACVILLIVLPSTSRCNGDIARELAKRYNDDRMKCDKNGKLYPVYQCSGLIIRGVRNDIKLKFAWSIKSSAKEKKAFSFAFLRKDTRFLQFPRKYDSGFIIYPHLKTPWEKNTYKVYCAFPLDAHSDGRAGHGCGQSQDDTTVTSKHCDGQEIKTLSKWISLYDNIMSSSNKNLVTRQCAFDMTMKSATEDFVTVIKANTYLRRHSKEYSYRNNELVVHRWNEKNPKDLPIEAFFYIRGVSGAYEKAAKYQDQYYKETSGETVPIVGIRLPTKSDPSISIKYKSRKPKKH